MLSRINNLKKNYKQIINSCKVVLNTEFLKWNILKNKNTVLVIILNFKMQLVIFKDIKKTFAFTTIFNYKTKQIFEKF